MISYDSITLIIPTSEIDFNKISKKLKFKEKIDSKNQVYYQAKYKNLTITIKEKRTYISGSVNKFIKGNNLESLSVKDIQKYIDSIISLLKVQPEIIQISRIDIAVNISTKYPVPYYLQFISGAKYKKLGKFEDTIYLNSSNRKIRQYDKLKEMKQKDKIEYLKLPLEIRNQNILRVEFSILKQAAKYLKQNHPITLNQLSHQSFIKSVTDYCLNELESIRMFHIPSLKTINTPNDLYSYLMLKGIESLPYPIEIYIKSLRKLKIFKNSSEYNRAINTIKRKIEKHKDPTSSWYLLEEVKSELLKNVNDE